MSAQTLRIALGELGQKEIKGHLHNKRILEYQETTGLNFGNDDVAWCSIFANWVAKQAGLPMSGSPMARSWTKVGKLTYSPTPGDVIVFWRKSKNGPYGHVGFFLGYTKSGKSVYCIGGNQNDEVNITAYPLYKVLQFRDISSEQESVFSEENIPTGYLREGDSNVQVKLLQQILIALSYLNDTADGVFGSKTEKALRKFQKAQNITIDGIYGSESRGALMDLLHKTD